MRHKHTSESSSGNDQKSLERRRLQAAKLFERGKSQAEVARRLGVSREAARKWHRSWNKRGAAGLKSKGKVGRPSKLSDRQKTKVEKVLLKGPRAFGYATNVWTLKRIAVVIQKVAGVRHHPGRVWHVLKAMDWSCQKPQTRAKERNDAAIERWVKHKWPRIKKKPEK